jgi:hypothetical protein
MATMTETMEQAWTDAMLKKASTGCLFSIEDELRREAERAKFMHQYTPIRTQINRVRTVLISRKAI